MVEKTHAELESEHYKAVRTNPEYRMAGYMEVMLEERLAETPYSPTMADFMDLEQRVETLEVYQEFLPTPARQEFNQLKGQVVYLQNKVNEHTDKSKRKKRTYTKYE